MITTINPRNTLGAYSTDPSRPDYACPAYQAMFPAWQVCEDVREGTDAIRAKSTDYLPRFEAEVLEDYNARVAMTFLTDAYALTLDEHVGLVMASPIKLGDTFPGEIEPLVEDFNGEGDHLDVFASDVFDAALHFGHVGLWTDYPNTSVYRNLEEKRRAGARPYAIAYKAPDIPNWETVNVAGSVCLTFVSLREWSGGKCRYRHVRQAVTAEASTGRAIALGPITFVLWEQDSQNGEKFTDVGSGTIEGPEKIPLRVIYGGQRLGVLRSRPHLYGLAMTSVEHVQVTSDYASVMHKVNVPTPIFIGRDTKGAKKVQMGQGIDLPLNGDAKFLEPTGAAIAATEKRLANLEMRMQRQGATTSEGLGKTLTATEAAMISKSRNAKLRRAATSLKDGFEGSIEDMGAFMGVTTENAELEVNTEFAGDLLDPALLNVYITAYKERAIPLEAMLYALEKGKLPEDFSRTDAALKLLADWEAAADEPEDDPEDEPEDDVDEEKKVA